MASFYLFLLLSLVLTLTPTALSATCKTQIFKTPNKSFAACSDLPRLSATLHYTFNASSSTLSMAFTAAPSTPAGWVAWAINPTASAMAGSQTLLAYRNSSSPSSVTVSTLDVVSYRNLSRSPLSLDVSGLSAESSGGRITVFGTWRLPAGTASVNQVWQVGPSVDINGNPTKHDFKEENLKAMSTLRLTEAAAEAPAPAPGKNAAGGRVGVSFMGLVLGGAFIVMLL